MSFLKKNGLWALLVLIVTAVLTYGPYIALNIIHRVSWPFWRVPFVPIALYDSNTYFAWTGEALSGLQYGSHLSAFDAVLRVLGWFLPTSMSVAEVWLFTLWASVTIFVWLFARALGEWSGLSKTVSRWLSVLAACSFVLPHFPRPGVFTWYVPFYAFGLLGAWRVQRALDRGALLSALLWSAASVIATFVYPYFVIHIVLWIGTVWFLFLHEKYRRATRTAAAIATLAVVPLVAWLLPWLLQPKHLLAFELRSRIGLAFTRLPLLSNSLYLVIGWTVFIALFAFTFRSRINGDKRIFGLAIGWMTLLMAWLSNVWTGVYIQNDHFRAPAVMLAWLSLAVVWRMVSEARTSERDASSGPAFSAPSRGVVFVSAALLLVSSVMVFLYAAAKAYVFRGDYLNVIHVSHWLTLAAATYLFLRISCRRKDLAAGVPLAFAVIVLFFGVSARAFVYAKEASAFQDGASIVPITAWIRGHVPPEDGVCADPRTAQILGAFTGRFVYPSFVTFVLPKSDERIMEDQRIELAYYDAVSANATEIFFDKTRGSVCYQFSLFSRIFSVLGTSKEVEGAMTGCPAERMRADEERIRGFMAARVRDDERFQALCPAVVIPRDQSAYWTLPASYRETDVDGVFSVWRPPSSEPLPQPSP